MRIILALLLCIAGTASAQWQTPLPFAQSHIDTYSIRDATGMEVILARGWDTAVLASLAPEMARALRECQTATCVELVQRLDNRAVRFEPLCGPTELAQRDAAIQHGLWSQQRVGEGAQRMLQLYGEQAAQDLRDYLSWVWWWANYPWPKWTISN
jgi:hypothetical protein